MTKRKLRKNAEINPPQSPHDGIHTCSKGCNKPGCNRTLRDTIEEQDQQIEALKRDVLEKTTDYARIKEDTERYRLASLKGDFAQAENARLKAEVEQFKFTLEEERQIAREDWAGLRHENARLKSEVERLTKAGDNLVFVVTEHPVAEPFVKAWFAAKEGKQP
jgi:hypothetical protein